MYDYLPPTTALDPFNQLTHIAHLLQRRIISLRPEAPAGRCRPCSAGGDIKTRGSRSLDEPKHTFLSRQVDELPHVLVRLYFIGAGFPAAPHVAGSLTKYRALTPHPGSGRLVALANQGPAAYTIPPPRTD